MTGCNVPLNSPDPGSMMPETVEGWTVAEADGVYDAETLFQYINGAAELYRSFNVKRVIARRYVKEGAPDILADVFDMGTPADAFGVYHHSIHEGDNAAIGNDSEIMGAALSFWKGRYYVSILAFEGKEDAIRAIKEIGESIA